MHKQRFKIGSSVISWKQGRLFLMILTDIADHFPTIIQLQCNARQKQTFSPLKRKIKLLQFYIFEENLETHLQRKRNDINVKELIECLVTVTDNIFPKVR